MLIAGPHAAMVLQLLVELAKSAGIDLSQWPMPSYRDGSAIEEVPEVPSWEEQGGDEEADRSRRQDPRPGDDREDEGAAGGKDEGAVGGEGEGAAGGEDEEAEDDNPEDDEEEPPPRPPPGGADEMPMLGRAAAVAAAAAVVVVVELGIVVSD